MRILYLEDDMILVETVEEYLQDEGFDVDTVYDGEKALESIYAQSYDLLLLDVNVPSINGFELLKILRDADISTPAIFITSLNSIEDLSQGYSVGADDYVKKPFILKELLFRIHALLKREYKSQNEIITLSQDTNFNTQTNELHVANKKISLNPKETLLLKLFLKHQNECITFQTIFQHVWSYEENHSDMSLRTYIKTLRKYLGKERILSMKKVGYKFV